MTPTWRQIRALNYGTIGRTVHGKIRRREVGGLEEFWFDPPGRWRTAIEGEPTLIVTPSDRYSRTPDGMLHTDMSQDGAPDVIGPGGDGRALVAAHLNWPIPGLYDPPSVGGPIRVKERTVHGRRGWELVFSSSPITSAEQTFVIDAETGLALAWYRDDSAVELVSYDLDEVFEEGLFEWEGSTIEYEYENVRWRRRNEAKQQLLSAMPQSVPAWMPLTVFAHPSDGDPRAGQLEASIYASGPSITLRRWPAGSTSPSLSPLAASHTQHRQIADSTWTHEVRWENGVLTESDADRILHSIAVKPSESGPPLGSIEAEGVMFSGPVHVSYGQYYLSSEDEWDGDYSGAFRGQRNGLAGTRHPANVILVSGLHTGTVTVTLEIGAERSEPDLDSWEEIVEVPLTVESPMRLTGWSDDEPGTVLPISPGTYRLRYCANNMDAGRDADVGEFIDSYLISVWPSVISPDQIIKQTSATADYWNNHTD